MEETEHHLPAAKVERWLLAAICSFSLDHQTRTEIIERLTSHVFASPEHEVIFRALVKIPRAAREHIRETLSARLTRLGFPDIDVEPIFELAPPPAEQIRTLLRQLSR